MPGGPGPGCGLDPVRRAAGGARRLVGAGRARGAGGHAGAVGRRRPGGVRGDLRPVHPVPLRGPTAGACGSFDGRGGRAVPAAGGGAARGSGWPLVDLLAVGVPAVLLVLAMAADRRGVPVLGRAVQAYNAYRVGNLIFPFAVWGVLTPVLVLVGRRSGSRSGTALARVTAGACGVCALATTVFYTSPGVPAGMKTGFVVDRRPTAAALVTWRCCSPCWAWWRWSGRPQRAGTASVGRIRAGRAGARRAAGGAVGVRRRGAGAAELAGQRRRGRVGGFEPGRCWPPTYRFDQPRPPAAQARAGAGVVVDCKDLPYGGTAYREWTARLDAPGGWAQCASYSPAAYDGLSGAALDAAARRYGAKGHRGRAPRGGVVRPGGRAGGAGLPAAPGKAPTGRASTWTSLPADRGLPCPRGPDSPGPSPQARRPV